MSFFGFLEFNDGFSNEFKKKIGKLKNLQNKSIFFGFFEFIDGFSKKIQKLESWKTFRKSQFFWLSRVHWRFFEIIFKNWKVEKRLDQVSFFGFLEFNDGFSNELSKKIGKLKNVQNKSFFLAFSSSLTVFFKKNSEIGKLKNV